MHVHVHKCQLFTQSHFFLAVSSPSSTLSMSSASRTPSPFHSSLHTGNTATVAPVSSAGNAPHQSNGIINSLYSRKVFVGGLPPDIDEGKR